MYFILQFSLYICAICIFNIIKEISYDTFRSFEEKNGCFKRSI